MKAGNRIRWMLDKLFQGYYLEKYVLKDGKKHPLAIICPGGGYHWDSRKRKVAVPPLLTGETATN